MPLNHIEQPQWVKLTDMLRLVAYDGNHAEALNWYQDEFVYFNSEGISNPDQKPDLTYLERMYTYLDQNSELYFIEVFNGSSFVRIGDVAIKPVNPPIVIGHPDFRGLGYSKIVMQYVIDRLKTLGFPGIEDSVVYKHNVVSLKLHQSLGFVVTNETETEYRLSLAFEPEENNE